MARNLEKLGERHDGKLGRWIVLLLFLVIPARAEDTAPVQPSMSDPAPAESAPSEPAPRKRKPKGIKREKEAEGTKAPNRFQPDINVKSHYQYGGQPLEVDTD